MEAMMNFTSQYTVEEALAIEKEFSRLKEKCYLDHAGTTLYADSQIRSVCEGLAQNLYCNPHTSRTTEDLLDQVRYRVLRHFNTRSSEYSLIFTSGTTASLKLLAESYEFAPEGAFVYLKDSHTSVLGMREIVGTERIYPVEREQLLKELDSSERSDSEHSSLIVFPAQCNFNGVKYPLELVRKIQRNGISGYGKERFRVCLDAASFVSTSFLDLSKYQPDFVCLSFYKIFGYPTGLGALLVHHTAADQLRKKYYGGGTVKIAMAGRNFHVKRDPLVERFEDGTLAFTSIIALLQGFETLERLVPSTAGLRTIERISQQTFHLGRYCYNRLKALRHSNGNAVVKLYHDTGFEDQGLQGGIVNFNILHEDGTYVGFAEVSYMASLHNILLRTGCFCNPGACQRHLQLSDEDVLKQFDAGHVCGDANDLIDGQPTGSVRVSFGYMTRKEDIDCLLEMVEKCYIRKTIANGFTRTQIVSKYKSYDQPRLKMICLFPIKSCGAFKVTTRWPLSRRGLKHDREFVIVDENGVALTQKKLTEMCLIRPQINLKTNEMTLSHPSMDDFVLDLDLLGESQRIKLCQTKVCQDNVQAIDCGDQVAEWISVALQTSGLRLLKQSDEEVRTFQQSKQEIALANQAQFLLINQASVRWLADKVPDWDELHEEPTLESLVDRFRGNLIVETPTSMEECDWKRVTIGYLEFAVDGPCSRCQMICIDQGTGVKTTEPLRTIGREFKGKMRFGIYLSHVNPLRDGSEQWLYCNSVVEGLSE
ncbi:AAEL011729-PA [Aedes aegypti]|uniref:Molybdenum cofactor sulfurase 3 n=1 Tax=Aedes aegypti TaxID=7159 RepID=MOCO3_AEDAE|nr:RecName: Full=Molybdenum cofactor sulfurase 3; Short=MCS 3; Short=MOS 3; Short=MoCo sulfurase 3; AltName: Full=Molybdenum cofactor sulfurtransferase 3; AltName: Full=Protein maroon-like 3; Short=Ma-l 3 [Aedes aegypti]EAT36178.1 AAEL011729-PA [Aedes aegypti]